MSRLASRGTRARKMDSWHRILVETLQEIAWNPRSQEGSGGGFRGPELARKLPKRQTCPEPQNRHSRPPHGSRATMRATILSFRSTSIRLQNRFRILTAEERPIGVRMTVRSRPSVTPRIPPGIPGPKRFPEGFPQGFGARNPFFGPSYLGTPSVT